MKELEEALNKVRALKNPTGPSPADILLRKWKMRELGDRVGKAIEKRPNDEGLRYQKDTMTRMIGYEFINRIPGTSAAIFRKD